MGSDTGSQSKKFTLSGGYNVNTDLYIEGKYKIWSGETVFTFSSYTISSYNASSNDRVLH